MKESPDGRMNNFILKHMYDKDHVNNFVFYNSMDEEELQQRLLSNLAKSI